MGVLSLRTVLGLLQNREQSIVYHPVDGQLLAQSNRLDFMLQEGGGRPPQILEVVRLDDNLIDQGAPSDLNLAAQGKLFEQCVRLTLVHVELRRTRRFMQRSRRCSDSGLFQHLVAFKEHTVLRHNDTFAIEPKVLFIVIGD